MTRFSTLLAMESDTASGPSLDRPPVATQHFYVTGLRLLGGLLVAIGIIAGIETAWDGRVLIGTGIGVLGFFFGLLGQVAALTADYLIQHYEEGRPPS
jgi:hypothetical protein